MPSGFGCAGDPAAPDGQTAVHDLRRAPTRRAVPPAGSGSLDRSAYPLCPWASRGTPPKRFIQTLLREWAYVRLYQSNEERREALAKWLHYYNHHRSHTALEDRAPASASVNNVCGNHT